VLILLQGEVIDRLGLYTEDCPRCFKAACKKTNLVRGHPFLQHNLDHSNEALLSDRARPRSDRRALLLCSNQWCVEGRPGAGAVRQKSVVAVLKSVVCGGATGRGPTEERCCCAQVSGVWRGDRGRARSDRRALLLCSSQWCVEGGDRHRPKWTPVAN